MNIATRLKQLAIISKQPVHLKNAGASDLYVDIKKTYGYPDALNLLSEALWREIDKDATCIATAGYGGLSPASVIAAKQNLNLTLVREVPKKHGRSVWIDGYVPQKQDNIVIVDDVFTTGGSLKKIMAVLKPTGAEILGCYVVVKRGEGNLEVPLIHLITLEDLL